MKNPLAGADLYDWIALRRVSGGGVTRAGDCWLDSGHRVPGYVTDALTGLLASGLVTLAEYDSYGLRRSALTDSGAARYARLCQLRQAAVQVPAPGLAPTVRGVGVDGLDPHSGP